jgi:YbbR domain-containing protein
MVISGPERHLAAIKSVLTSEIDVTGATAMQEVRVNAYVSDPLVQLASPAVTVRLNIEKGSDSSRP